MKLSNTMIMNETLLPSNKKAFTLAEVLITLSILGVVAALTIPSLVNRQSEMAAIVKLKKAISQYESVAEVYMAENEATKFDVACDKLNEYFKIVDKTDDGCQFTTADGVAWVFGSTDDDKGNAIAYDSAKSPRYGVVLWTNNGLVNSDQNSIYGSGKPTAVPAAPNATSAVFKTAAPVPTHNYFSAATMLKIDKSKNADEAIGDAKGSPDAAAGIQAAGGQQQQGGGQQGGGQGG